MFHKVTQSGVAISMAIVDSHTRYRWMRSALWRTATVSFAHPASARAPQSTVLLIQRLPEPGEEPCRPVSFAPDPLRLHIDADLGRDGTDRLRSRTAVECPTVVDHAHSTLTHPGTGLPGHIPIPLVETRGETQGDSPHGGSPDRHRATLTSVLAGYS